MSKNRRPTPPKKFVAIPLDDAGRPASVIAEPVFHDGRQSGPLLSGEVRCTLTALTPLLVANDQYAVEHAADVQTCPEDKGKLRLPAAWGLHDKNAHEIGIAVARSKKILEPLRLVDGRVAFAGTGPKGMLSTSLGALLAAPMSRVRERVHFYRPNQKFSRGARYIREGRPAIVEAWDEETHALKVRTLNAIAMSQLVFVRDDARNRLPNPHIWQDQDGLVEGVILQAPRKDGQKTRLIAGKGAEDLNQFAYFNYRGGMDGTGEMAELFRTQMGHGPGGVYNCVLVPRKFLADSACWITAVPERVLYLHELTLRDLVNEEDGHLRAEHPQRHETGYENARKSIRAGILKARDAVRAPGQLIYVEVELDGEDRPFRINSIGHNYYYLARKIDTVTTVWTETGRERRTILSPLLDELAVEPAEPHSPPAMLSAQRGIFGYTSDAQNPGTAEIGTGDFRQLAGRVGFNTALEVIAPERDANSDERFLVAEFGSVIPLKVLGAPRTSDEAAAIQQSRKAERTDNAKRVGYGEIFEDPRGELKGRAIYLHQPDAADDESLYSLDPQSHSDSTTLSSNQASLARFVSSPGTQFRVALRFRDLRDWELGAILTCLRPTLLEDTNAPLREPGEMAPRHAVKLGHGRPLGMGSVRIDVDDIRILDNEGAMTASEDIARTALNAFSEIEINVKVRREWLDAHKYNGRTRSAYPTAGNPEKETTVAFYADETSNYAIARREWNPAKAPKSQGKGGGKSGKPPRKSGHHA